MEQPDRDEVDPDEYEPNPGIEQRSAEVPEADAIEQHQSLDDDELERTTVGIPADASEADVLEQLQGVLPDDDEPYDEEPYE